MRHQPPRILLMGLMGAGKTQVGRALADHLDVEYLDNDELLAKQEGVDTVTLSHEGPDVLHLAESRQLRSLAKRDGSFVASAAASLGDRSADCAFASDHFFTVYLHVDPDVLAKRVSTNPERPFLSEDALDVESGMYARRDPPFRATADFVVDGEQTVSQTVDDIVSALEMPNPH